MARNPRCTVYVGNLDEKVTDRILYEILIQVGRVVDLYIPRDKGTNCHKGYAFAEYESEEVADYAVRLFSGLVHLYNKTLKFTMSGQDKTSQNVDIPRTPKTNLTPLPRPHAMHGREVELFQSSAQSTDCRVSAYGHSVTPVTPKTNSSLVPSPCPPWHVREVAMFQDSPWSINCRVSAYPHAASSGYPHPVSSGYPHSLSPIYPQVSLHGFVSNSLSSSNFDYDGQVFDSRLFNVNHSDIQHPIICS